MSNVQVLKLLLYLWKSRLVWRGGQALTGQWRRHTAGAEPFDL